MGEEQGRMEPCEMPGRDQSVAPSEGAVVRDRFSPDEIFQRVIAAAEEEVETGTSELFFSALAAGFSITTTVLLYASMTSVAGGDPLVGAVLYPVGFVYIILGHYQLYTENTLPPVALVLERLVSVPALLSIWALVLTGNIVGGAAGAAALAYTGIFSTGAAAAATELGLAGVATPWWDLFWKAVMAGFIVAGVVWLDYAARETVSRFLLVYVAFLSIPVGGLYHIVVSATEVFYLVFLGEVTLWTGMTEFALPVLIGNTVGGVLLVTVVNYFQTRERDYHDHEHYRLSPREWILGRW